MSVDLLINDERFKKLDLDRQVDLLGKFYEEMGEASPDLRADSNLVPRAFEVRGRLENADEVDKPFLLHEAYLLKRMSRAEPEEAAGIQQALDKLPGERKRQRDKADNIRRMDLVGKAFQAAPGAFRDPKIDSFKGAIDKFSQILTGAVGAAQDILPGGAAPTREVRELMSQLDADGGPEERLRVVDQFKKERLFDFEGKVMMGRMGDPVVKPSALLMEDDALRAELKGAGFSESQIENYMENVLPLARKATVDLIATLRFDDWTSNKEIKDDLEYARATLKDSRESGAGLAFIEAMTSRMKGLAGGLGSLLGVDAAEKTVKQAAALALINEDHPTAFAIGGVVPDLVLALGGGSLAAGSARAQSLAGMLTGAGTPALQRQAAAVGGSAVASGASAGLTVFGQAREQGFSWMKSLELGLKQFIGTAGLTAAFGARGIESVFAKGTVARQGLVQILRKALPEGLSEGAEEAADEILSHFTVQQAMNPDATAEDLVEGAMAGYALGFGLGAGVSIGGGVLNRFSESAERARESGYNEVAEGLEEKSLENTTIQEPPIEPEAKDVEGQAEVPVAESEAVAEGQAEVAAEEAPTPEPFTMTDFDENLQQTKVEANPETAKAQLDGRQQILQKLRDCLNS